MLELINLYKNFGKLKVLENLNIKIKKKEFVVLLGPNGCGKTTILRIIAGLEEPTKGNIMKREENIGFIFQESVLFPWRNVEKNIEFGLEVKNIKNRKKIIKKYIKLIGLIRFENYHPEELSGGMKQKVALARTLAVNPSLLLVDEPFSSLDALTRKKMQKEFVKIWQKTKKTIIFVTHDIEEALFLADRIILLSERPASIISEFEIKIDRKKRDTYNKKLNKIRETIIKKLS